MSLRDRVILVDKPAGWTSFDVVAKIRSQIRAHYRLNGIKPTKKQLRVGHAGTLDPFATGLLIILLGEECKNADNYLKLDKVYEFTARLGETSTTGDPEGDVTKIGGRRPKSEEVKKTLEQFTGKIEQTPPAYSAIKINGQRAYKLAREGKKIDIPIRKVTVHSLELISYEYPLLKARCHVSSGTYIRSLVEDIGQALGTGAYCSQLRRMAIGDFKIENALTIDKAVESLQAEDKIGDQ
jgi:tRNA pseudouridine55 synthase